MSSTSTSLRPSFLLPTRHPRKCWILLYEAIRAEPGSRYHDMAERRTRCVTVHYADGMHLDVTPLLRRPATPERESWLFHHRERTSELGKRLVANPYGFAAWFNERMPLDRDFVAMYRARSLEYERTVLAGNRRRRSRATAGAPGAQVHGGDCASVVEAVAQRAVRPSHWATPTVHSDV